MDDELPHLVITPSEMHDKSTIISALHELRTFASKTRRIEPELKQAVLDELQHFDSVQLWELQTACNALAAEAGKIVSYRSRHGGS